MKPYELSILQYISILAIVFHSGLTQCHNHLWNTLLQVNQPLFRVTSLGGFTPWRDLRHLLALKFEGTDWINLVLKTARGIFQEFNIKQLLCFNFFSRSQAFALNKDGNFFVSGGFSRYLRIWRTHDLCLLHTYPPCDGSIRALTISTDQRCVQFAWSLQFSITQPFLKKV